MRLNDSDFLNILKTVNIPNNKVAAIDTATSNTAVSIINNITNATPNITDAYFIATKS